MENKIRLISIERSRHGIALIRSHTDGLSSVALTASQIYYPGIINKIVAGSADVIALDIYVPCDVTSFIRELRKKTDARILVTCDFNQPDLIFDCLLSGASGFVEKYCTGKKFEQALADCMNDFIHLPLSIWELMYARKKSHHTNGSQRSVLILLSKGFTREEVIQKTGLSGQEISKIIFSALRNLQEIGA